MKEIIFGIYDKNSKDAKAIINDDNSVKSLKLLKKCPKRFFYSIFNDASQRLDEILSDKIAHQ